jgi:HlyD family secretion protein
MLKTILIALLVVTTLVAVRYGISRPNPSDASFKTAIVQCKDLSTLISATGTLEPCDIIDVGAQVAGRVIEFGIDPDTGKQLDYGSRVTKGMVLAKIDPSVYEIEVAMALAQSKRSLAQQQQAIAQTKEAEASVLRNEAELVQQQSKLDRSQRDLQRAQGLSGTNSMSAAEMDSIRSEYDSLKAGISVAQATIGQSRSRLESQQAAIAASEADLENTQAVLERARRTLEYCSIVSPIDGTIIDRRVNQGQTVVASLSTPSLFLLASNLQQLEIWVSVNEADIGQIKPAMPVRFVVDALPDETFQGKVKQIRLNASMSQNVVTYTVVVSVDNNTESLLPYLTANVDFIVKQTRNALCIPAKALRFTPESNAIVDVNANGQTPEQPHVWIADAASLRSIPVRTGVTDGIFTEIQSDQLKEGDQVLIGYIKKDVSETTNPFVPKMPGIKNKNKQL